MSTRLGRQSAFLSQSHVPVSSLFVATDRIQAYDKLPHRFQFNLPIEAYI